MLVFDRQDHLQRPKGANSKMKHCLAIICHAGAKQSLEDFWPLWRGLGVHIAAFLPQNDRWPIDPMPDAIFNYGASAHGGPLAYLRVAQCIQELARQDWDAVSIIEPDCVPLAGEMPRVQYGYLSGWLCECTEGLWPIATLPPWTMDRRALKRMAEKIVPVAQQLHQDCLELTDRWLNKAASACGVISVHDETIQGYTWFPEARDVIKHKKHNWVHGFKTKEALGDLWPEH